MEILTTMVFLLISLFNIEAADQMPRRDETYPPPDFLAGFKIIHDVCVEKTGVTSEAIKEFSDGEVHEDPALKCYMNCIFHELNVVDDDGEMHLEKMKRLIPENLAEFVELMVDSCHSVEGETQCDRAWSWHVCWKNADPKHYFLA